MVIIGGGIAGLCAAVYARKSGYDVEVLEQHDNAGGLATSWRRGDYTFETCLHWLLGANPERAMYALWREVFDIDRLKFVHPDLFARIETEDGEFLDVYANVERMEAEFLRRAPQDATEIRRFAAAVRRFTNFELPDPSEPWPRNWLTLARTLPYLRQLRRWSNISCAEYGRHFTHPLLRSFFGEGGSAQLAAVAVVLMLAWLSERDAGYAVGGSQAIIALLADNLRNLGGRLRTGTLVEQILVELDTAVGVRLAGGETVPANWVISAADSHATTDKLLGGGYGDANNRTLKPFPSYLQVSLGVARDLSRQPGYMIRVLDRPLLVEPGTELSQLAFRFFHFDPSFAPPGKTAVTCFIPTENWEFWTRLRQSDPVRYQAEKQRIADAVIAVLERRLSDIRPAIEVIDVSSPATVVRYTSNWRGSYEGWLLTPGIGCRPLRNTLPGLSHFLMAGQWVMPGGGLPAGLFTARSAI
jgi:phytoene dehydrogenase-like protein